ncbi:cation-transporting ATPase, partial [Candidatus Saccharibacteria bacterium]|nr:cation-transporting ATPase [Candidatus Saccharibacteria bacterium]
MNDVLGILKRNFISPIVIAILVLAVILLALNEPRDAGFLSVVIVVNTLIAVVQEIRAQRALKKLELMNAPFARLVNEDGTTQNVTFDKLLPGDKVKLVIGDEVPADGVIIDDDGLEVNESILTGESAGIDKNVGSAVYAASGVTAGSAVMQIDVVGGDTKIGKMASVLKRYKAKLTPMQASIARAITPKHHMSAMLSP